MGGGNGVEWGPLTWGCSVSSWFGQSKKRVAPEQPLQHPSQLSPGCRLGRAQQSQTGCNVSSSPAERTVLPLEKKLV